jgi:hypothetical protein
MVRDRRCYRRQRVVAAVISAAATLAAVSLQADASGELGVSVKVVRRCAVSAAAVEQTSGERLFAVRTTCGNVSPVMVDLSTHVIPTGTGGARDSSPSPKSASDVTGWQPALAQPGQLLYVSPSVLPHSARRDGDLPTVLTVNF